MADTWYLDYPPQTELTADQTQALEDHAAAIDAASEEFIGKLPPALEQNLAAWSEQRGLVTKAQTTILAGADQVTTDNQTNNTLKELFNKWLKAVVIPDGESHPMLTAHATAFYQQAYRGTLTEPPKAHTGWHMTEGGPGNMTLSQTRVSDQQQQWGNQSLNRRRNYAWWHDTLMSGELTAQELMPTIGMQSNAHQGADHTLIGGGGTTDLLQGTIGYTSAGSSRLGNTGRFGSAPLYRGTEADQDAKSYYHADSQFVQGYETPECGDPEYRKKRENHQKCSRERARWKAGDTWHAEVLETRGSTAAWESAQKRRDYFTADHGTGAFVAQGIYTQNTLHDLNMKPRPGEREGMQTGDELLTRSEAAIDTLTQGNGNACNMQYALEPGYRQPIRRALKDFYDEYYSQETAGTLDATWKTKVKTPLGGWGPNDVAKGKSNSGIAKEMESALKKILKTYQEICKIWKDYQAKIQQASEALSEALKPNKWSSLFKVNVGSNFEGEASVAIALADRLGKNALKNPRTVFESNQERLMYKEQCFLLAYIKLLSQHKKEAGGIDHNKKAIPYEGTYDNASLLIDGDAYGFMNRLTSGKNQAALHNLDTNIISNLQPMIRLFKVETNAAIGQIEETEFHFSPHAGSNVLTAGGKVVLTEQGGATHSGEEGRVNSLENALQTHGRRGEGVGVQSFNFTYDGSNPFAIKKSIKANLKIFANSFNDLFEDRGDYMYADLALKTGGALGNLTSVFGSDGEISAHPCAADSQVKDKKTKQENEQLAKLNFRLKVVVGWALPPGRLGGQLMSDAQMDDIRHALADSYVTLELTPTVHSFDIDEFGRVVLDINYLAYVEDFFDQPTLYNVFSGNPGAGLTLKALKRELQMALYKKECKQQQISQIKSEWAENIGEEKQHAVQGLLATLSAQEKIYTINLKYDEVRAFVMGGPFYAYHSRSNALAGKLQVLNDSENSAQLQKNISAALDVAGFDGVAEGDDRKTKFRAALFAGGDFNNVSLQFFYLSDLIDVILFNIERELKGLPQEVMQLPNAITGGNEKEWVEPCAQFMKAETLQKALRALRSFRVMLGPVEFYSEAESASYYANLGDVPISVKYFLEWLTEKMLKKEETIYSLSRFLNDLMNDLVRNFLNNDSCFAINASQKVKLHQASLTSYPPTNNPTDASPLLNRHNLPRDELTLGMVGGDLARRAHLNWWINEKGEATPVLNTSGPYGFVTAHRPTELAINYMTYFVGRVQPLDRMRGKQQEDEKIGLFHYILGRDKGLIKNIKLVKTQTPGLQEVRFEQEGYDGLEQLRVVYDVEIETYANVKVYPGTYIFVEPRSFSPGQLVEDAQGNPIELTKFGLGGYYMVYKVESSFAAGKADTVLHAKWVNQLHKDVVSGNDVDPAADAEAQQGRHIYTGADNTPTRCKIAEAEYKRQMEEAQNAKPPGIGKMIWTGTKNVAGAAWDKITFWN